MSGNDNHSVWDLFDCFSHGIPVALLISPLFSLQEISQKKFISSFIHHISFQSRCWKVIEFTWIFLKKFDTWKNFVDIYMSKFWLEELKEWNFTKISLRASVKTRWLCTIFYIFSAGRFNSYPDLAWRMYKLPKKKTLLISLIFLTGALLFWEQGSSEHSTRPGGSRIPKNHSRIAGGIPATDPWDSFIVYIAIDISDTCLRVGAGTIIDKNFILTARHVLLFDNYTYIPFDRLRVYPAYIRVFIKFVR